LELSGFFYLEPVCFSAMIVEAKNLTKKFGDLTAVDGVDFSIKPGECFGLLGPNGAGKSTIISMLYGAAGRTGGDLTVFAQDPAKKSREIKKRLGVVTQENALDTGLNVIENMILFAKFVGVPKKDRKQRVVTLLEFMSLSHKAKAPIRALSGGMQRRLVFVRALLNDPDFIILDEPTTGLDPAVRQVIWNKIRDLQSQGKTVLLTTHYMDEAEMLCNRIVIMNEGIIKASGSPKELINENCPGYVAILSKEVSTRTIIKNSALASIVSSEDANGIILRGPSLGELSKYLEEHDLHPRLLRPANLEDAFLAITGRELTEDA
jgi:lipooligosaccharide transport system ATP-binding protein